MIGQTLKSMTRDCSDGYAMLDDKIFRRTSNDEDTATEHIFLPALIMDRRRYW